MQSADDADIFATYYAMLPYADIMFIDAPPLLFATTMLIFCLPRAQRGGTARGVRACRRQHAPCQRYDNYRDAYARRRVNVARAARRA